MAGVDGRAMRVHVGHEILFAQKLRRPDELCLNRVCPELLSGWFACLVGLLGLLACLELWLSLADMGSAESVRPCEGFPNRHPGGIFPCVMTVSAGKERIARRKAQPRRAVSFPERRHCIN